MSTPLERVRPGDIISAADWNLLVDSVNAAMLRIQALESGGTGGSDLAIEQIFPPGPYRIGDTLQIVGRNFQFFAGATRVFFNATQALTLSSTSTDTQLELTIPSVPGVLESGTTVDLIVSNQSQSTQRQIVLRPRLNPLQGSVSLEWQSVTPSTIQPGQPAAFVYRVRSATNNAAVWDLTPAVQVAANAAAWNAQLRMLDAQGNVLNPGQVTLQAGQQIDVQVQIQSVPSGTSGMSFGLSLAAASGGITGNSGLRQFTVGTPTSAPDTSIALSTIPALSTGLAGDTITVPGGGSRDLAISAEFSRPGSNTYGIEISVVNAAAGWSIERVSPTLPSYTVNVTDSPVTNLLRYRVSATALAVASAQIQIQVQRQGSTSVRTLGLNVRLPSP
jgi:hypothetical protein